MVTETLEIILSSVVLKYPFEFAKTRAQLSSSTSSRNPFAVLIQTARNDGVPAIYTGCTALILVSQFHTLACDLLFFLTPPGDSIEGRRPFPVLRFNQAYPCRRQWQAQPLAWPYCRYVRWLCRECNSSDTNRADQNGAVSACLLTD